MNKLAANIKNLRQELGISQTELANKLSTTVKTVSHWETGYSEPSVNQLIDIANFFDVSLDELLGRK